MSASTHGEFRKGSGIAERGAQRQTLNRRLFMRCSLGGCSEPRLWWRARAKPDRSPCCTADLQDARSSWACSPSPRSWLLATRLREVLGADPFGSLAHSRPFP